MNFLGKVSQSFGNFEKKIGKVYFVNFNFIKFIWRISYFLTTKKWTRNKKVITVFVIIIKVIHKKGI